MPAPAPHSGHVRCELCLAAVPTDRLLTHLRMLHPDAYEPVETWPDGAPVVVDTTLTPTDFRNEQRRSFRRLVARSALGCPTGECDQLLTDHTCDGYDTNGDPINARCP